MGIDFGTKNVGIALSDEAGISAYPKVVLHNDKHLLDKIKELCDAEEVGAIIIGESVDMNGADNPIMEKIREFGEECAGATGLSVAFEKEAFTSFEAHPRRGKESLHSRLEPIGHAKDIDAKAAALILQRFLDKV
jgi:putative Holliday junction resolvase